MNSDSIKLVQESYGSLTTTAAPLSVQEFDENNIAIYKDFESLSITIGVPAYDAGTTYNDDTTDSKTDTFATYGNRFWQWVNAVDGNSTPAAGSDWVEVFPTMLAHEKNKDSKLKHPNSDMEVNMDVIDISGNDCPFGRIRKTYSGINFDVGVIDTTPASGGVSAFISATDSSNTGHVIEVTSSGVEIKHQTSGTSTLSLKITNGNLNITGLPTSAIGLSAGDLWSDTGTGELKIVT